MLFSSVISVVTEITVMTYLPPIAQKFILHWGEMGMKWGINRTVAQVHALLYISEKPLNADEICEGLGVARSNVSNSLKELQNWGIVRIVHVMGDRRDHFESMSDVYEMFRVVLAERKRREIDPTLALLRACLAEVRPTKADATIRERLSRLLEFFELGSTWYDQMSKVPTATLLKCVRLGEKIFKLLQIPLK